METPDFNQERKQNSIDFMGKNRYYVCMINIIYNRNCVYQISYHAFVV